MINPFDKHLTFLLLEIMWEKTRSRRLQHAAS